MTLSHQRKQMKKLEEKVPVIAGGVAGTGFAAARWFVQEAAYVSMMGRQSELDRAARSHRQERQRRSERYFSPGNILHLDFRYPDGGAGSADAVARPSMISFARSVRLDEMSESSGRLGDMMALLIGQEPSSAEYKETV
jgi:hypothetical protein